MVVSVVVGGVLGVGVWVGGVCWTVVSVGVVCRGVCWIGGECVWGGRCVDGGECVGWEALWMGSGEQWVWVGGCGASGEWGVGGGVCWMVVSVWGKVVCWTGGECVGGRDVGVLVGGEVWGGEEGLGWYGGECVGGRRVCWRRVREWVGGRRRVMDGVTGVGGRGRVLDGGVASGGWRGVCWMAVVEGWGEEACAGWW